MGSDRTLGSRLATRCCYGAYFAIGFLTTTLILAAMFWIVWCYFGLAIVQVSDTQRRAIVNYSYTSSKPSAIPVTTAPNRSTSSMLANTPGSGIESSINSISKSPTAATILRGSSRGESPLKLDKKKESPALPLDAKGDFAARDRATQHTTNQTLGGATNTSALGTKDSPAAATVLPPAPSRTRLDVPSDKPGHKAAIVTVSSSEEEEDEDRIHARRVSTSGIENRKDAPDEKDRSDTRPGRRNSPELETAPKQDIAPTQVFDYDTKSERPRRPAEIDSDRSREETRTRPKDFDDDDRIKPVRRDEIQSSRRPDSEPAYRDPDFERDYPRRLPSDADRGRSRYDSDDDDDRGSRSRYDRRDRGRDSDDRYSKGDTRVYPDEDGRRPLERERDERPDDRYRDRPSAVDGGRVRDDRDRYPDDIVRRGDDERLRDKDYDDRYRDSEGRYRYRDTDTKPRYRDRDDRYRDDDRYASKDDRHWSQDDDRYRPHNDDGYRTRGEDRYRTRARDDDGYIPRNDDRPRDRPYTDRITDDKDTYRPRGDGDRYIDTSPPRSRDSREPIASSRVDDDLTVLERKPLPIRPDSDSRSDRRISEYDIDARDRPRPKPRDEIPDLPARPASSSDRYRDRDRDDDYRRPSRYDDKDERITPTRTRDEAYIDRSTVVDSRPRDDDRYIDDRKDSRDDRYRDEDDRVRNVRIEATRGTAIASSSPASSNSRRFVDERHEYRTRSPDDRRVDAKYVDRDEEVVLDRRSYASEEDDEYRRRNSRTRTPYDDDDRSRRPVDDSRRDYADEERYTRRRGTDDEEYARSRPRGDDTDRTRNRHRVDDEHRRYDRDDERYIRRDDDRDDDRYVRGDDDRYIRRDDTGKSSALPTREYDRYLPDEDDRIRRKNSEERSMRREGTVRETDRVERPRVDRPPRADEEKRNRDTHISSRPAASRRYDDDPVSRDTETRRPSVPSRPSASSRELLLGSSMTSVHTREPSDVVIREKRFQNAQSAVRGLIRDDLPSSRGDRGETRGSSSRRDNVEERPLNAKDVIEAALRHSDASDKNSRKVYYPVFDPRVSNLTSPEIIRQSERRGTTITAKKRKRRELQRK